MAHQRANLANGLFGAKRRPQQTHRMQVLKPLAIQHVGFSAGNMMHMLSIHQVNFDSACLQNLEQRYPIHTGGFHSYRIDAASLQPVGQLVQILCKRGKRSHRVAIAISGNADKDFRRSQVNTPSIRSHFRQTPIQFAMLPSLRLSHGLSPFRQVRQGARRARYGTLSSGIIATKNCCCVSPMLLRTGLGSNSSTGSQKANTNGVTTYAYRCRFPSSTTGEGPDWTHAKVPYCYWPGPPGRSTPHEEGNKPR